MVIKWKKTNVKTSQCFSKSLSQSSYVIEKIWLLLSPIIWLSNNWREMYKDNQASSCNVGEANVDTLSLVESFSRLNRALKA